jgi:tetratricopeptide (TPR) repeat protein
MIVFDQRLGSELVTEAEKESNLFRNDIRQVPLSRTLFNNTYIDILTVAKSLLDGELEYRRGNFDKAFEHLRQSITLSNSLPYDEPWAWMQSRYAYGPLLLEQGHIEKAAAVYRADLGLDDTVPRAHRHSKNVWALHGYHESVVKLGRTAEASRVNEMLTLAGAEVDIPIVASCFCRLKTSDYNESSMIWLANNVRVRY